MVDRRMELAQQASSLTAQDDRRLIMRVPAQFGLMYSGIDAGRMLIGDGRVTNLSEGGIGIYGNRLVTPGMELALFVDLPGSADPVCISEGRVSWVTGRRFGVQLLTVKLDAHNQLRFFLCNRASP
jgi:PilZ domain-containing protein